MLEHFVRVGKSVGKSEMLGRFICGFLAARAHRRDLEFRKRAQGWNVGIAPPAVAYICSNDANTNFFSRHECFSVLRLACVAFLYLIWAETFHLIFYASYSQVSEPRQSHPVTSFLS
jgi:hypothetical protein